MTGAYVSSKYPRPQLNGQTIEWTYIDKRLTMRYHVNKITNSANSHHTIISSIRIKTHTACKSQHLQNVHTPTTDLRCRSMVRASQGLPKKKIQSQQKEALRKLTTAPRYVKNATIARDLRIEPLKEYIHRLA